MATLSTDPAEQISAGLAKVGMVMRQHAWQEAMGHGLTPTQIQILTFLDSEPGRKASVGRVARALALTAPTASDAITALEAKKLVRRRRHPKDGRRVEVTLTAAGRRRAAEAAAWTDFLAASVTTLSEKEQAAFLRGLVKMIRSLQEAGKVSVARMCVSCVFFRPHVHEDPDRPHHCAYVDAPFGDRQLRLECPDHKAAAPEDQLAAWRRFTSTGT